MGFLLNYELYASEIYYNNKKFTPKQLVDYFEQTKKQDFASSKSIKKIVTESQKIFKNIMNKHDLTIDQILQAETSNGGKALAHLALLHCDMCCLLNSDYKDFDELLKAYCLWKESSG